MAEETLEITGLEVREQRKIANPTICAYKNVDGSLRANFNLVDGSPRDLRAGNGGGKHLRAMTRL